MITKGQKVRLNELGIRFFSHGKGVPKRKHAEWDGRTGVVAILTKDQHNARIIWAGNRGQADALPIRFLEEAT
jgi:hypothetical protein